MSIEKQRGQALIPEPMKSKSGRKGTEEAGKNHWRRHTWESGPIPRRNGKESCPRASQDTAARRGGWRAQPEFSRKLWGCMEEEWTMLEVGTRNKQDTYSLSSSRRFSRETVTIEETMGEAVS